MKPSQVSTLVLSISLCCKLLLQASRVDDCRRALRSKRESLSPTMHSARHNQTKEAQNKGGKAVHPLSFICRLVASSIFVKRRVMLCSFFL